MRRRSGMRIDDGWEVIFEVEDDQCLARIGMVGTGTVYGI